MAFVMFGQFESALPLLHSGGASLTVAPNCVAPIKRDILKETRFQMMKEEAQRERAWAKLEEETRERYESFQRGTLKRLPYGFMTLKKPSIVKLHKERIERENQEREERIFDSLSPFPITHINMCEQPVRVLENVNNNITWSLCRSFKQKKPKRVPSMPKLSVVHFEGFLTAIGKICKKKDMSLEIIDGRKTVKAKTHLGSCYVRTKHMDGARKKIDLTLNERQEEMLFSLAKGLSRAPIPLSHLTYGDSGRIILNPICDTAYSRYKRGLIVRGEHEGKIYDARVKVTRSVASTMRQF
ncbi:putative P1 protein, partial [Yam mosaic virus]